MGLNFGNVLRNLAAHDTEMANSAKTMKGFGDNIRRAADTTYAADIADAIAKGKLKFNNGQLEGDVYKAVESVKNGKC